MKLLFVMLMCLMLLVQQSQSAYPESKVFKQNKSSYTLSNSNNWTEYPELKITLELAQSRLAFIGYVITIGANPEIHLVTRLVVDQSEVQQYRAISGNTIYHTNAVSGYVFLSAGRHEIRVDYRTPGNISTSGTEDWTTANLQVVY